MKLIIIIATIACVRAAKLNRVYLPPNSARTSGGSGDFLQTPVINPGSYNGVAGQDGFNTKTIATIGDKYNTDVEYNGGQNDVNAYQNYDRIERPRAALERNAAILRQINENDGDRYSYAFETENGIVAEENGVATDGVEAQGGYSYTGDDGQVYSIRYTAGQNGFIPEGDHLPTPPPIPEEILMALEQNARDEAAGIYDDGSYNENKYTNGGSGYVSSGFSGNGNQVEKLNDDDSVVVNSAINGFDQQSNLRNGNLRNQGRINKVYLPPSSTSSSNNEGSRFSSKSRQSSFNPRTGYNY
ncbi:pupal cuticle protein 27-like isoform X2 [Battus philenor]|uniref:pupal cuticle protein 27-like isoform X2 n=1 Tax=Battus philenor TaxID=42288 RepID=UPI0035D0F6EE